MEFDKYNVYSEFDRNEVTIGTYGVFASSVSDIGYFIKDGNTEAIRVGYLYECVDDIYCFGFSIDGDIEHYRYFYPLEEPISVYRPFKDAKEAFEYLSRTDFIMPKEGYVGYKRVLDIGNVYVYIEAGESVRTFTYQELLDSYIMTDGTPCGVKMED